MFQTRGLKQLTRGLKRVRVKYKIAQRYYEAENPSNHLAGVATIVDLCCWVPCQEFVLIIYDRIAHVMSILYVYITDVYKLY